MSESVWLRTSEAARHLNVSQGHLKRLMDSKGGPLQEREHYLLGLFKNSPIRWNVEAVRECFHRRGMLHRAGENALHDLVKEQ